MNAGLFGPTGFGGLLRDFASLLSGHLSGAGLPALKAALTPKRDGCRVFTLFLWRGLTILDLPARNVDHELGGLAKVARAFGMFVGHDYNMR